MSPTVKLVTPETGNAVNVTPLTVWFPVPGPEPVGQKLAEAKSVPVVSTSDVPEMFVAEPQLITAAFAGSPANERASAVTVTAAKMFKDFGISKNSQLREKGTRPEEERKDL